MRKATASAYLDMSPSAFANEVARGRLPKPVSFGGSDHWYKPAIDDAIDLLVGNVRPDRIESYINYDVPRKRGPKPKEQRSDDDDRPFSVSALAERWSCSDGLVRKLIKTGELPSFRYGKLIRISAKDVVEFEARR